MANPPVVGDTWVAIMQFKDRTNTFLDPQYITFYYRKPVSHTLVTTTYTTGLTNFRKVSTGDYEFDIPCQEPGTYEIRYETDLGVQESSLTVVVSRVLP